MGFSGNLFKLILDALGWLNQILLSLFKPMAAYVAMFPRWIALALLSVSADLVACVIAPVLPAFAIGRDTLPRQLRWVQTPDNTLDGDKNFIDNVAPFRGRQIGVRRYINRVFWLWRNPAYGFDIEVLWLTAQQDSTLFTVGTLPMNASPRTGWYFAVLTNADGTCAWQFYAVKRWGAWASRVNCGWKLRSVPGRCQFIVTVQPYLSISTN